MISSRVLVGLEGFLKKRGVGLATVARCAGLQPTAIRDTSAMLPINRVTAFFERAAQKCHDRAFGLHFAEFVEIQDGSLLHYLMANSATVRDALYMQARYSSLMFPGLDVGIDERRGHLRWTWTLSPILGSRANFCDFLVGTQLRRIGKLVGKRLAPARVEIDHIPIAPMTEYERLFGRRITFACRRPAITIDHRTLSHPIADADPRLHVVLAAAGETALGQARREQDLLWRAGESIVGFLKKGRPDLVEIAASLNVSQGSLRRELKQAGKTFQDLVDEARRKAAEYFLQDTITPMTEIAYMLGYSEASAFSRAFKNWFGCSPREFRRRPIALEGVSQKRRGTARKRSL